MEEKVTQKQIQIMHKFSIVVLAFLGLMLLLFYLLTNYYPSLTGKPFLSIILIPFVLSLWTIAYMGIKHKVIGSIGFKYPTYHGQRAQIVGYLLIGFTLFAIIYLIRL